MTFDDLKAKLKNLSESVWENRARWTEIQEWLDNFLDDLGHDPSERLHALYLLSNFMYFGSPEMRELLKSLFRDLYQYPILAEIRHRTADSTDAQAIKDAFQQELKHTRFLGVGNPSESGTHLLYYFRQENNLPKTLFINEYEVFDRYGGPAPVSLRFQEIMRYVFIDDLCGSGKQAKSYSRDLIQDIKRLNPRASAAYYVLFATTRGLEEVRVNTEFDHVDCVFELDASFKCFSDESRYFPDPDGHFAKDFAQAMSEKYGNILFPAHPLGYKDGQLLIGFHHNTPDNTLPIIWCDEPERVPWTPIFRRYPKVYGWGF